MCVLFFLNKTSTLRVYEPVIIGQKEGVHYNCKKMKDGRMSILLFYLILRTTFFTFAAEIGSVLTAVIKEEISDASSEFAAKDHNTNLPRNLSLYHEFTTLPNEFPQNDVIETQLNSSLLQQLENGSCETEAMRFGYKNNLQMIFHEILCELNKLLRYGLITSRNLKSEFHIVIQYSLMQDAISLNEPILNRILSDIVGRRIVRLEEFLGNTKNVKTLFNSIKKCVPISNIQTTVNRLHIAVTKLLTYIQETFAYLQFHNDDESVKNMTEKIFITKNEIINLFHRYLSNNLGNTTDLLLTTIARIELVFDAFKIYARKKLYIYLTALEEFINIMNSFYDRYCASELSKTITYLIFSTNESYNLFSSNTTRVPLPEDILEGLSLDHLAVTSTEESGIQPFSESRITTHLPINMYNLPALNQLLSDRNDSRSSTPDKNLVPNNYGQSKYLSLESTSPTFVDINSTSNDNLANYPSGLSYLSPTTMSSINNILQSFDMNMKSEVSTPLLLPSSFPADKTLLKRPFPYILRPETSPVTHSTSDISLHKTLNQQPDTNVQSFPITSPFPEKQIAESDSWNYTIPFNPPDSSQLLNSLPSLSTTKMLNPIINQNYNESFNPTSSLISNSSSRNMKSYVDHSKSANSFLKILYNYPEYINSSEKHMPSRKLIKVH